jgi:cyanophycinase
VKTKPVYLLAGGRAGSRRAPDPLIQAVFRESSILSPTVACVGTANGDSEEFFSRTASSFREAGASRVTHALITPEKADINKARDILKSADIIFVSGGDVERGMVVLEEKNMTGFLKELYSGGKPFFGLSAGSIMLAREWVRWRDPDDDSTAELFPCLGIAPVICDTHSEQDDWEELKMALKLEENNVRGYGIVSGTAIKVFSDGSVESLGGAVHQYLRHGRQIERISDILPVNQFIDS